MGTARIAFPTFVIALLAACGMAVAGTVSVSATAPVVDGADIAQLVGAADAGGDLGHIWNNRPAQGQTFTTGNNPAGYWLSAVTLKNLNNTTTSGTFTVRVGKVSGTAFSPVISESMGSASYVPNDFITASFASPIYLAPHTSYGFDWGTNGGGFVTVNNLDPNAYTGGTAYSSGSGGVGNTAITPRDLDRVFHADVAAKPQLAEGRIGFNFVGGQGGGIVAANETAGAPGHAQANWNNLATDYSGNAGAVPNNVVDSNGTVVGTGNSRAYGLRVEYDSNTVWGTGIGSTTPDQRLMRGYLDDNGSDASQPYINLYNIPYNQYDLVLYVDGDQTNGVDGPYWLETLTGQMISPKVYAHDTGNFAGLFTQVPLTSTTTGAAVTGNYLVFEGLEYPDIRIRGLKDSGTRAPINGFQIEAVPEPATMILMGMAVTGIAGYLRRRRK